MTPSPQSWPVSNHQGSLPSESTNCAGSGSPQLPNSEQPSGSCPDVTASPIELYSQSARPASSPSNLSLSPQQTRKTTKKRKTAISVCVWKLGASGELST